MRRLAKGTGNDQKLGRSAEAWVWARLSDHDPMIESLSEPNQAIELGLGYWARDWGFLSMKTSSFTDENDQFDEFSNKLLLFQKTKMGTEWIFISYFHFVWSIHYANVSFPSNELSEWGFQNDARNKLTSLINQSENTKWGLTWAGSEQVFRHNVKISSSWRVDLGKSSFSLFA